jgi:glycosyltransferase involved in cell wall biosynthesis
MKFVFYPVDCPPFHGKTLEEQGLRGQSTSVIRMAEALDALGHDVTVITEVENPPLTKPRYVSFQEVEHREDIDVLIVVRGWKGIFSPIQAKKRFVWTGAGYNNPRNDGIGILQMLPNFHGLLLKSEWHKQTLCSICGFPLEKAFVLFNGVNLSYFDLSKAEKRHRKRLIYSSSLRRGVKYLPEIYQRLKKKHPELELHIFGPFDASNSHDFNVKSHLPDNVDLYHIFKELPDCYLHGFVTQKQLAQEFMKSALLAYPTDFEETCASTTLEAQAAGCAIITTDLAAMKETVGEAGALIQGYPTTQQYQDQFVESVDRMLSDDDYFTSLSQCALRQAQGYDWSSRAKTLLDYLAKEHKLL